jgi:hypothetical protein
MPQTQGAAIPGWDLSQYPNTGSPTANIPVPIDQQIAALINGGGLTGADKIARISDLTSAIPAQSVAAVRSSGVLDEIDIQTIVAIAPFVLMPVSRVWLKGNICYVSISVKILAQTSASIVAGIYIPICSGLPLNPANSTGVEAEGNGTLLVTSRYSRATQTTDAGANIPFKSGVASIDAAGKLCLGGGFPLVGNPTAGYTDYLSITGHYPITLVDSIV